jgi:hypothetical protein
MGFIFLKRVQVVFEEQRQVLSQVASEVLRGLQAHQ